MSHNECGNYWPTGKKEFDVENDSIIPMLLTAQQSFKSMVMKLTVQGVDYGPFDKSVANITKWSEDGPCYSVKPRTIRSGRSNGVELLLDAELFDNDDTGRVVHWEITCNS